MSIIFKGKVKSETPEQSGTSAAGKEWVKKDFVLEETEGEYPNSLAVTNFNNKVSINVGDSGEFYINSRVNEYNGKVYNSLNLWRVEKTAIQPEPNPSPSITNNDVKQSNADTNPNEIKEEEGDGLPF